VTKVRRPPALLGPRATAWRIAKIAAVVAATIVGFAPARPALAHASLLAAVPADGLTVLEAPKTLRLEFNEPVSPLLMRLVRPTGEIATLTDVAAADKVVTITLPEATREGTYVLSWRVVSADGHPVGGVVTFALGHPSSGVAAPPVAGATALHIAIWVAQFILSIGLFVGAGGAIFVAWLAAKPPPRREGVLFAAMACGLAAAVVSIPLQGLDALAQPLSQAWRPAVWAAAFATSWGWTAVVAALTLVVAALALIVAARTWARVAAAVAMAGIGAALAVSGHAGTAEPRLLTIPSVLLHGLCVAFWVGSLLPLALAVGSGDGIALQRFSRLIPVPLLLLVGSGLALGYAQLDRLDALWTTDYGRVLSGKIAIVLVLLGLGALNRYALVPRLATTGPRLLVRVIGAELALAVAILGLVGLWRFTPPPRALAATETTYIHLHGEPAMAQIDLTPERGRGAAVRIAVTDEDFGPVAAKDVTLVIWKPADGIEPIRRVATFEGRSLWRIAGLHIPVGGVWRMRVEILIDDFRKVMLEDNVELPRAP
jgi:copper transport protein